MKHRFEYRVFVEWSDEDECYVARVPALPGCAAHGDSADEAVRQATQAAEDLLSVMREDGQELPEPDAAASFSGNIRLRIPKSLHRKLDELASANGVSLNTLMVSILSTGVGERSASAKAKEENAEGGTRKTRASTRATSGPG